MVRLRRAYQVMLGLVVGADQQLHCRGQPRPKLTESPKMPSADNAYMSV